MTAVCLCGSYNCRGTYLGLANTNTFDHVIQAEHSFLERLYLIYKAVANPQLSPAQLALLESHGIKNSLLGGKFGLINRGAAVAAEVDGVGSGVH